ncbi:MAG: hypothetical protein ACI8P0_006405 [Planctomycetaceae bacterium]|jgi:hypothetical protein
MCGIPADVSASKNGFPRPAVEGEDPLLAVAILKVADVCVRVVAVDNRGIATGRDVMVADRQQWLGHDGWPFWDILHCRGSRDLSLKQRHMASLSVFNDRQSSKLARPPQIRGVHV